MIFKFLFKLFIHFILFKILIRFTKGYDEKQYLAIDNLTFKNQYCPYDRDAWEWDLTSSSSTHRYPYYSLVNNIYSPLNFLLFKGILHNISKLEY